MVFAVLVALFLEIAPSSAVLMQIMSNETSEFSVKDGKLVKEESEEANFEENLTFDDESDE